MADQGHWFKLWCSAPGDSSIQRLPVPMRWAWAALGAHIKRHGTSGVLTTSEENAVLRAEMGLENGVLIVTVCASLPHVKVRENSNGTFTVTWMNWHRYQEDSTAASRQAALRQRRRDELAERAFNVTTQEEKRREQKRTEESTTEPPIVPHDQTQYFADFWVAYPRKVGKQQAEKAWAKLCPSPALSQAILSALLTQCAWPSWTRDNGQFIPHPATWLNGRRWEDEPMDPIAAGIPLPRATQQTLDAVRQFVSQGGEPDA